MKSDAFHSYSNRLPITEPMHVIRAELDNLRNTHEITGFARGADNPPPTYTPEDEEAYIEYLRALIYQKKQACSYTDYDLDAAIHSEKPSVRAAATDLLGMLEEKAPIALLLEALTDSDWDVRAASAQALGRVGKGVPIDTLIEFLLKEEHEIVQEALIGTLGLQKERAPLDVLTYFLQDGENWLTRVAAAQALGAQGKRAPIRPLIQALKDSDEMVREAAARVLGELQIKDMEIINALIGALGDTDEAVQEAVEWALDQTLISPFNIEDTSGWPKIQRKITFSALTEFIRDRKGSVQPFQPFPSHEGRTLLVICDYQQAKRSIVQILQDKTDMKFTRKPSTDFDEVVHSAISQALKNGKEAPWDELLIVSFTLSSASSNTSGESPLRIVISGMGYSQLGSETRSILDQIMTTWAETTDEPLLCPNPQDLVDLKIWYQPSREKRIFQLT